MLKKISYSELKAPQKEIYNFQKVSGLLADYGFNCIKLIDDWHGADFLAYHKDGETLKVQLKGRLTIAKKYLGKALWMAFPTHGHWYLVEHDRLVEMVRASTNWLNTNAWKTEETYHSANPNPSLLRSLSESRVGEAADDEPVKSTRPKTKTDYPPVKREKQGVGHFIRTCIKNKMKADEILEAIREKFPNSKATISDVNWNRNMLRRGRYK
jgi:hypothetical protein